MNTLAYKTSGVDIEAGELFAELIKQRVTAAWPGKAEQIGKFAGEFMFSRTQTTGTGSVDGAGTMAIVAALCGRFSTIGHNAAAMSLLDVYVDGSLPVALLDIIDVARLLPEEHIGIIDGLIAACLCAESCQLIGGETAELPDLFRSNWMVCVNTAVIGQSDEAIITHAVQPGQNVWGWRSEGPAANGFSLIRSVCKLRDGPLRTLQRLQRHQLELGSSLADALLRDVPVWINQIEIQRSRGVNFAAHAHITGGGLVDNIPRVLPEDCKVVLDRSSWTRPPIFALLQEVGKLSDAEMDRVFNQGIMVVSIVDSRGREPATPNMEPIGRVEKRVRDEPQVQFTGSFS